MDVNVNLLQNILHDDDADSVGSNSPSCKLNFLIVDDEYATHDHHRLAISYYLHNHKDGKLQKVDGLLYRHAYNGEQALDVVEQYKNDDEDPVIFHAILMDDEMEGNRMAGVEAITQLRSMEYNGTIFGVSWTDEATAGQAFLDAGADGYMRRPLNNTKLAPLFDDVINKWY